MGGACNSTQEIPRKPTVSARKVSEMLSILAYFKVLNCKASKFRLKKTLFELILERSKPYNILRKSLISPQNNSFFWILFEFAHPELEISMSFTIFHSAFSRYFTNRWELFHASFTPKMWEIFGKHSTCRAFKRSTPRRRD